MMARAVRIRQATASDAPRLLALDADYADERKGMLPPVFQELDEPMSCDRLREIVTDIDYRVLVAEEGSELVGFLVSRIVPWADARPSSDKEGKICDLYVRPPYRGQGVASSLHEAAVQWFRSVGCAWEVLTVYDENPAQAIYRAWGFVPFSIHMRRPLDRCARPES